MKVSAGLDEYFVSLFKPEVIGQSWNWCIRCMLLRAICL